MYVAPENETAPQSAAFGSDGVQLEHKLFLSRVVKVCDDADSPDCRRIASDL